MAVSRQYFQDLGKPPLGSVSKETTKQIQESASQTPHETNETEVNTRAKGDTATLKVYDFTCDQPVVYSARLLSQK